MQHERLTWAIVDAEAGALGAEAETRRKWRQANRRVPYEWRLRIMEQLSQKGVDISASDFDALPANPGRIVA